jgi:hypothetical protein
MLSRTLANGTALAVGATYVTEAARDRRADFRILPTGNAPLACRLYVLSGPNGALHSSDHHAAHRLESDR